MPSGKERHSLDSWLRQMGINPANYAGYSDVELNRYIQNIVAGEDIRLPGRAETMYEPGHTPEYDPDTTPFHEVDPTEPEYLPDWAQDLPTQPGQRVNVGGPGFEIPRAPDPVPGAPDPQPSSRPESARPDPGFQPYRLTPEQKTFAEEHYTQPSDPAGWWGNYFRDQALWLNVPQNVVSQEMSKATITNREQADVLLGQLEQKYNPGFYAYRQHRIQMGESVRALSGQQRSRPLTQEEQEELSVLSPRQFQHLMGGARAALGVLAKDHGETLDYQEPIHRQELIPRYPKSIPGTGIRAGDPLPFAGPEIPETHVLREKGAAAVPVNYMAATWMGRSPTSVWWNLMEEPPKEASEKAQEKYRKAQQDFGKRERAAGMHEQWGLRTPDPTGGLVSRQITGRHRAGPLARTPEQYTRLQTAYTMTGEHYMSGIATIDLPKTSEWYQEQTKEVWLGTGKERTQEVFPKGVGHTWEAGEKRQWIEGGAEETSQFGGMVTGVRPTWRTVPDPLTGKQQTEQGYRFTYERIAPAQGQMMPKIGDQPGKQVLQQGDLSSFVHAETGKPLGVEMVMFGKLASGLSSSVFQALPKKHQKEVMKRAIREQPDLADRKRSSIAYGEIAPTMMKYVQEQLPDWVVPATEKNVEMHRDVLESGVYKGMITGDVRESQLGERFGIADLSYPVMIPPHGTAQQVYMEYGVNEPRMNMEMLRQIERVDPGLHRQIVDAGKERRSSYRRVGRAALASQDPAFMRGNTLDMTQEHGRHLLSPGGGTLFGEAEAARASLEEQGLSGKESAAAFMRGGAPEAMQQNPMLFQAKGESVVMPALNDFSVLAASGLFPDESVSKLEMMGYNVIGGALRGETGHGQADAIARYREAQREWTSSGQFGRETQSIYLPSGPGKSGDIFGFGAVASYHRKLGDDEAYSPFVEGGRVGNVWGQPVQHGGKHFTPDMEVNWLSSAEMERRGLPTDVAAVGMQMWQAAARDWDADLMYGLMKAKARWDPDKQMWTKPDGSVFSTTEATKLGRESLQAGAGDVMEDIIQGYKDPVTGERRPHTPAEAIEKYTEERMSGFRQVSLEETRASIHERATIQSHIGPYYMTYRQGLAMSRSERETQAVEAFHQRSHGFAQRPAKLPEWAQRIHTAMTWTERSGVYERYKDKTAAAPYRGVSGLMREMQSALVSSYLLPKGERKEQGVMKARDISSLLAPKGRRGEFRQALKAGRKVGPSAEAGLLETLRGMPNLETESPMGRWGVGRLIYSMRQEPIRDEKSDAFQGYRTRTLPEFTEALRNVGMLPHEDLELSDEKRQELEQAGMMKASELYMMGALQKAYRRSQAKDLPAVHDPNAPERGSAQEVAHALTWAAETGFGGGFVEVAAAAKEFGYALPGNVRSWKALTEPMFPGLAAEGADAEIRLTEPAALAEAASERGFFGTERDVARSQAVRGDIERAYKKSMNVVYPSALNWGSKEHMLAQEVSATFSQMERMGKLEEGEKEILMPPAGSGGQGQRIHELTQKQAAAGKMPGRGPTGSKGWFVKVDGEWEEQPIRGQFPGETGKIRGRLDLPWGMEFGGKKWGALDIKPMDIDVNASRAEIQAAMDEQMTQRKGVGAYRAQLSTYHWLGRERGWDDDPTGVVPYPKALRDKPKKAAEWIRKQLERGGPFDVSKHMMSRESTIQTIQAYENLQAQMGPRIMEVAGNIAMGTPGFRVPEGLGWGGQIKHFGQYLEAGDMEKIAVAAEQMGVMPDDIMSGIAQMGSEGAQAAAAGGAGTGGDDGDRGKFLQMFANFLGGQGAGAGGGSVNMSADFGTMQRVANIQRQLGYVTGAGADLARVSKEIQRGGQRPSEGQRRLVSKIRNPLFEAGELVKGLDWVNQPGGMEALQEAGRTPEDIKEIQQAVFDLTKTRREVWDSQRGLFQNIEQQEIEATVRQAAAEAKPFATQGLLQLTMGKLSKAGIEGFEGIRPAEVSALMGDEVPSFAQMEEMGFKPKTQRAIAKLTREQGPEFALQEAERIGGVLGKDWTGSKQDFAKLATNVKEANEALEAIGGLDKQTIKEKGKAFAERLDQAEAQLKRAVKGEPVVGAAEYMRDRGAAQLADLESLSKKRGLKPAEQQRLQGLASMAVMGAAPGAEEIPEAEQVRGITDRQRMREAEAAISGKRMPGQPDRRGFQDMGLAGAAAGTVHRFMSGWELMRLRRMWGMTGQPVFDQYIPAAAQYQMANWQMATQAAGYGGPPGGAAGGAMELQAGKQRALIQAGEIGYDAWGWAAPMMQGFQKGQAAWGPAVGAGLVGGALASTIGMTTGMSAAVAATTVGLPISAAIAGTLGVYAAGQYAMAGVEPTVPNMAALYEAQQAGTGGPSRRFDIGAQMDWEGLQETRAFLGLPETERPDVILHSLGVKGMFTPDFNVTYDRRNIGGSSLENLFEELGIGDTGVAETLAGLERIISTSFHPSQGRDEQKTIKETEQAMIQKYEELRGTPMTDMEARFRTGMIGDTIQNLAEMAGTAYPMLAPEQIQGAVGELMPYMEDTTPEGIEKYMKSEFAQQVAVTGVGPEAMRPVAEQLRMGRDFRMKMAQRISPLGAADQEDLMTAMGQWAPLQRFGYTADEIFQSVMPDETGGRPLYGRADMEKALLGETATRKKLTGQEAIAQEEAISTTGMYAQAMGKALTSPEVQEFWEQRMEPLISVENGRFQIQNAAMVIQPAAQAYQMTGRPEEEISAEFIQALDAGQTVQGLYMMNQIEQGQGPLQIAAGIPAGFTTDLGRRAYGMMQQGIMKPEQMTAMGGAIGFGRTQMGYSMMADGWGSGYALSGLYAELGIEGPAEGAQGFYDEQFRPIGQVETLKIQRGIQTRQREYQQYQMDMSMTRLTDPQYGAFAQLETSYGFQMGGYEAGGTATGLLGQQGMHQEMMVFVGIMRDVNNRMKQLGRDQQWAGLEAQEAQALLGYRQGREKLGLARRRAAEDVRHQEAVMALQSEQMVTTQQWQREDIAWGRETAGLQYDYQMDELGRGIRLAGGREKQQLLRKREYMEEMYGREETKRNVDAERAEQRMEWERTRFQLERRHFEARVQFQQEEFDMQRRHMDENLNMQLGNIGRQKLQLEATWALQDERQAIQEEWEDRQHEVQGERIDEQIAIAEVNYEQAHQELEWRKEELIEAQKYFDFIKGEEDDLRVLEDEARERQREFTEWLTKQWETGGPLYNAIMELIAVIKGEGPVEEFVLPHLDDPEREDPGRPPPKPPVTGDSIMLVVDQQVAFKAHIESLFTGKRVQEQEAGGWGGLWQ